MLPRLISTHPIETYTNVIISAVNTVSVNTDTEVISCIFLNSSDFLLIFFKLHMILKYQIVKKTQNNLYANTIIWLRNSRSFY